MSDTLAQFRTFLRTDTARLMLTYLAIIMTMSVSFSLVLYGTSVTQLERQRPPHFGRVTEDYPRVAPQEFRTFISDRIDEGKREITLNLTIINLVVLAAGTVLSYYLARRTLEPIEDAMDAQTQFVSDASHELRTPLTALRTTNEVALRRKKLTLADAKQTITDNLQEIDRLQQLTDGLLGLLSRETAIQSTPVNLQEIIGTALATIAPKANDKRISVEDMTPPLILAADKNILIQILTILIDNAVKYSNSDTTITITATQHSKHTTINVTDQGSGITAQDISHIFSRFYRADTSRSQTEGSGLGLAIAHKLVKTHHGTLSVESTLGQGSTFTVTLPTKQ